MEAVLLCTTGACPFFELLVATLIVKCDAGVMACTDCGVWSALTLLLPVNVACDWFVVMTGEVKPSQQ